MLQRKPKLQIQRREWEKE